MKLIQTVLIVVVVTASACAVGAEKPNIIFILADDQGYGDLECFGAEDIATPAIDKLCKEGMKFTSFYVHNRCSPTRLAFMTGCVAHRAGTDNVIYRREGIGIHDNEITVAEKLKEADYATGIVGKWHLGEFEQFNPVNHGFDSFFGFQEINAGRTTALLHNNEIVEKGVRKTDGVHSPKLLAAGIQFIKANKDKPFFLYYASPLPHTKWIPNEKFKGSSKQGTYGDVIQEIDWQVGELLKVLDELDLAKKTLVIYASDNGPQLNVDGHGSAGVLRDGKWTDFEGGIRVPCIMRWPGVIPAGSVNNEITGIIDMLPTFCGLAGVEVPTDRIIDGRDIRPYMEAKASELPIHETYIVPNKTIRRKEWKLFVADQKPGGNTREGRGKQGRLPARAGSLYNLKNDLSETTDVSASHPEKVKELTRMMEAFMKELDTNSRPIGKVEGFTPPEKNRLKNNFDP